MDPHFVLETLHRLARHIETQVGQLQKANQAQCKRLGARIAMIDKALRTLESPASVSVLTDLSRVLQNALSLVQQFAGADWFVGVLKAGPHALDFRALTECLHDVAAGLDVELSLLIPYQTADQVALWADTAWIKSHQQEIISLNQTRLSAVQVLRLQGQERQTMVFLQEASMKTQLGRCLTTGSVSSISRGLEAPYIPYHDLILHKKIAEDASAKLYQGLWKEQSVVIKIQKGFFTESEQAYFHREAQLIAALDHPQIMKLHGVCLEEGHACMVMGSTTEGFASDFSKKGSYGLEQRLTWALDIAKALGYLHQRGMVYRELRRTHVWLDATGRAKLSALGLFQSSLARVYTTVERGQVFVQQAPECVVARPTYSPASDIYCFGVMLWEIMSGQKPLVPSLLDRAPYASLEAHAVIAREVPSTLLPLIRACCALDPSERPRAEDILRFIRDGRNFRTFVPGYYGGHSLGSSQASVASQRLAGPIERVVDVPEVDDYRLGLACYRQRRYADALGFFLKCSQNPQARDYPAACFRVLQLYEQSTELERDQSQVERYARIMTEHRAWFMQKGWEGDASAQYQLGFLYEYGYGVVQNQAQARLWYERAALQGDAEAQRSLGELYELGHGGARDYVQARVWYEHAALQGDVEAQRYLGRLHDLGQGGVQDYVQARVWYARAALQGDAQAQNSLGLLYQLGQGIAQDCAQARVWYARAALQGDAEAQCHLGELYDLGQGGVQDYVQARLWYERAALQGHIEAQNNLGGLYQLGHGIAQDYVQARVWYVRAALQGDAEAQCHLGKLYELGQGGVRDEIQAQVWYERAAAQGDEEAQEALLSLQSVREAAISLKRFKR